MGKYKKCPRCELNYILADEEMCDICKAELGLDSKIVLLDDIIDDDEPLKLCPVCKAAYIGMDEDMCENCLAREQKSDDGVLDEDNDDWRTYLDDDDTDVADEQVEIPLDELKEMEEDDDYDDDFEDEENPDTELDDYPDDFADDFDVDDDYDDEDEESDADDDDE